MIDSLKVIKAPVKGRSAKMINQKVDQGTIATYDDDVLQGEGVKTSQVIYNTFQTGSDGKSTVIRIAHELDAKPDWWNVQAASLESANILFVSADDKYLVIHYQNPPKAGKENLVYTVSYMPSNKIKYL